MGVSDKFPFPRVNKSGMVFGNEFNKAMQDLRDFLRFYANMGAYVIHPDQIAGALPSFASAIEQAQEVPAGWPVVFNLVPNTEYDEHIVIPEGLAEEHDIYFMNPFEDYTDQTSTIRLEGSLTLPATAPWASRHKMLNLFGVQTKDFDLLLNSGWDVNLRRSFMDNLSVERTNGADGCSIWAHDSLFLGNFSFFDVGPGPGSSRLIFSHCSMNIGDNPQASFIMDGGYQLWFIQSWLHTFLSTGAGAFDMRPPIGSFNGTVNMVDTTFECWAGGAPILFKDGSSANCKWQGANTIQMVVGSPATFDIGLFNSVDGWPDCRLKGVMPLNPPNGCRASDDKVDYRDKVWDGAAWV